MTTKTLFTKTLADLQNGEEADFFALLSQKEELKTRDGKPYWRVTFRDARREVSFPIWSDAPPAEECRNRWAAGRFYKLRAAYRETTYGPQLDIRKIRETTAADEADGFDPLGFLPRTKFDQVEMFEQLCVTARERIADEALRAVVLRLLETNRERLLALPAAMRNHHAFVGGFLEHVLSATQTALFLADKYDDYYPELRPRLNKELVVAGTILHDIGKLRELELRPAGAEYTPEGSLIGHVLQGRDMVREAAAAVERDGLKLDADVLLRLEHIVVSHQRLPEWGAPKPPMTPEAPLVHYADDLDAKYNMLTAILRDDSSLGPVTSKKNVLMQAFYRGPVPPTENGG